MRRFCIRRTTRALLIHSGPGKYLKIYDPTETSLFSCETPRDLLSTSVRRPSPLWPPLFPLRLPSASRAESAETTRQLLLKDRYNLGNNPAAL